MIRPAPHAMVQPSVPLSLIHILLGHTGLAGASLPVFTTPRRRPAAAFLDPEASRAALTDSMNVISIQSQVAYGHVGNSAAVFPMPVSYTHLDVYKRQVLRPFRKRNRSERCRGRSMISSTGLFAASCACPGWRHSDAAARFTPLGLSFDILPLTVMNAFLRLALCAKSSISFLRQPGEGFSPRRCV